MNISNNILKTSCSVLLNPPIARGLCTKYNARSPLKNLKVENIILNLLILDLPNRLHARILLIKAFVSLAYLFLLSNNEVSISFSILPLTPAVLIFCSINKFITIAEFENKGPGILKTSIAASGG